MQITVFAGGVGGSRFVRGVREECARRWPDGNGGTEASVTVIVNTGDDLWLAGVRLMPDFDSLLYSLAGVNDTERGWGRAGETERVAAELREWGVGWPWFTLGDLDLGTHLARTAWLREGATPSEVAARLQTRWPLGCVCCPRPTPRSTPTSTSPMPTCPAASASCTSRSGGPGTAPRCPRSHSASGISRRATRTGSRRSDRRRRPRALRPVEPRRVDRHDPLDPGHPRSDRQAPAPVVGVSPIIGGKVVRGMADACLPAIGVETTAAAVGRHYGARSRRRPARRLAHRRDGCPVSTVIEASGLAVASVPLWMRDLDTSAALAGARWISAPRSRRG